MIIKLIQIVWLLSKLFSRQLTRRLSGGQAFESRCSGAWPARSVLSTDALNVPLKLKAR